MKPKVSNVNLLKLKKLILKLKTCRTMSSEERAMLQLHVDILMKTYFPENAGSTFIRRPALVTYTAM